MAKHDKEKPLPLPRITEVTWEEPPTRKPSYDWALIADQLREHPMEWAKVFSNDRTSVANAIRQGSVAPVHPDLGFEVVTTNNVRGHVRICDMYMRFNPDGAIALRESVYAQRRGQTV